MEENRKLDEMDFRILELVQTDSRQSAETISEAVALSPAAVQKRLKKLRETGVIAREIAVLDPKKLDRNMTVVVEVSLERENVAVLDRFKKQMRGAAQVQQCYYLTGEADFLLIVLVRDIEEYEAFTQTHFFGVSNIAKFKTSVVMNRVKVSLDVI